MTRFVKGTSRSLPSTVFTLVVLLSLGCVLGLLVRRFPLDQPIGGKIVGTKAVAMLTIILVIPLLLPVLHRNHPWPAWLKLLALEIPAPLVGFDFVFKITHGLPFHPGHVVGYVIVTCVGVSIASAVIAFMHRFRRPVLTREPFCTRCGYQLHGLEDGFCPECGLSFSDA